ncbi:hypothetical protein SSBR45G_04730 [Bradyrhizobium sp. SSBR45G]|uniref:hypothetical protein n=1 Tax=unclassified Bradyrhizobium TaxID=2631580 RepID=UPI0023428DFE|nr:MULTISPECIES: hypothetical protein [unclassified Bradyrhizobium]GLH75565.1 hypothetical protein SSBR45G_04730 [Bradyrhizobium sp. SSBR45G]GLH82648.1 hypothetical protein SSBR45R_01080 [Bradyrhizobium sp. SSBR45R]
MPNTIIQFTQPIAAPSLIPDPVERLSDDECLTRLADAVTRGDSGHLDEIVQLIGRLAVVIE